MDTIIRMVAPSFGVSERDIVSDRQDETTLLARQTGMWLARRLTKASLPAIGRRFGRNRHTVSHSIERIDTMLESNAGLGQVVLGLMDCLTLPPVAA
jgi:chromosomal replication initiator protein